MGYWMWGVSKWTSTNGNMTFEMTFEWCSNVIIFRFFGETIRWSLNKSQAFNQVEPNSRIVHFVVVITFWSFSWPVWSKALIEFSISNAGWILPKPLGFWHVDELLEDGILGAVTVKVATNLDYGTKLLSCMPLYIMVSTMIINLVCLE